MNNLGWVVAIIVVTASLTGAQAPTYGSLGLGPIAPLVANCPTVLPNEARICPVGSPGNYALYIGYNGGAYQLLVPAVAAVTGVTTFNGRSGAVTLTDADVVASGVKVSTAITGTAVSTVQ